MNRKYLTILGLLLSASSLVSGCGIPLPPIYPPGGGMPPIGIYPEPNIPVPEPDVSPEIAPFHGISLYEAFHLAERWIAASEPGASLAAAEAKAVDRAGHGSRQGWTFCFASSLRTELPYRSSTADAAAGMTMVKIPPAVEQFFLTIDGTDQIRVSRKWTDQQGNVPITFHRTVHLSGLLQTVEKLGSPAGAKGYQVNLRQDPRYGAVFAIYPQPAVRTLPVSPADQYVPATASDLPDVDQDELTEVSSSVSGGAPLSRQLGENQEPGYRTQCAKPPTPGVRYQKVYLFNAYSGEMIAWPMKCGEMAAAPTNYRAMKDQPVECGEMIARPVEW
ncbi:MAG: hypothetical protein HY692_09690 [Cyanobacteria bacterium NC_groundwater_1444_Ag_S-0.65um_54_12]|nr:hypothetical protein [Cyanobacteria bacterium NC_groundwater_1444_Ag_S-0.65um_54_12]